MRDGKSDCDSCFPSVCKDLVSLSQEDSHFHDSVKCADITFSLPCSLLPYSAILILFECYDGISTHSSPEQEIFRFNFSHCETDDT